MSIQLVFVGFSGGSCSTLSIPVEVFQYAEMVRRPGAMESRLLVVTPRGEPLSRTGIFSVKPTVTIADVPAPDLIFLTGMDSDISTSIGENETICPWLSSAYDRGCSIAAVCPSQALLAAAGILDGRNSAIHWSLHERFSQIWPSVNWRVDDMVTVQDRIYTSCGGTSVMDLALYLVHDFYGEDVMLECARWFLAETPRLRQHTPPSLFEKPHCTDETLKGVQLWLHSHFEGNINFELLASQFGMSPRTFYRRFRETFSDTPKAYLQKLRLTAARRLLESDSHTVESICHQVGYEDPIFFRKIFKRHTGLTPSAYREKFRFKSLAEHSEVSTHRE